MSNVNNDLFPSLVNDIKSYSGADPLFPWLRGVRRLRDSLSPNLLKEKLPRFLQKCAQTFETDQRYKNDIRYIQIWLQLMDYVENPKGILRKMERNGIGMKLSLFYQAYALYYEKLKKFEEAEKIYRLGALNLAEPMDKLQKSYGQFLQRTGCHNNKNVQIAEEGPSSGRSNNILSGNLSMEDEGLLDNKAESDAGFHELSVLYIDDTVVMKFVSTDTFGTGEAESYCHQGLLEPTVTTTEAMDVVHGLFQEALVPSLPARKHCRSHSKVGRSKECELVVSTDENVVDRVQSASECDVKSISVPQLNQVKLPKPHQEPFTIYIHGEGTDKDKAKVNDEDNFELNECIESLDASPLTSQSNVSFVFPRPIEHPSESTSSGSMEKLSKTRFHEDTVVCNFVGAAISDEPEVENICHHGLVEPTVNLKEAMEDINNMFGKPIDFVRIGRKKKGKATPSGRSHPEVFSILCDDDLDTHQVDPFPSSSYRDDGQDMFEPTVCMKEAMDEINKMFSMPMDL